MPGEPVRDDEVLLRRIRPGTDWFQPPDRISSLNFKLRRTELGLSVFRNGAVSEQGLLNRADTIAGSFIVRATAGDIRALSGMDGQSLQLDVVAVDDEDNPGHAEIRGPTPGKLSERASKALRDLFARSFRQS